MKSKYKLKIKEISMRLKNGSVLLLGILCLFAFAPVASATDWTDPTCAAPGCNTDGPIWVNPDSPQDSSATSTDPMIYIMDSRTSGPAATAYVRSDLDDAAAIYGYSTGDTATSYGGYFSAAADTAPGLYVSGGVTFAPIAGGDPIGYQDAGLLYYSSTDGTYRYYDGSGWYNLPLWSKGTALGFEDSIYHSVAAGTGNGVAIKSGDLTGPNEDYTLDVLRVTQSTSDRAIYGRLTIDAGWDYYASGFMGGYDDSGNAVGVRGKVSDHMGGSQKNFGGYFEAAGGTTGTAGVYGLASTAGTASPTYGGYFQSNGVNGIGAYATGPSYGLEAVGTTGGIHAVSATGDGIFAEGDTAVYGYGQSYGGHFQTDSSVTDGAIGVWAVSNSSTNGVGLYGEGNYAVHGNSGFSNGRGVYGQHQGAAVGYGVYGTSSGSSGYGVYGTVTSGTGTNYGGYFTAASTSGTGIYAAGPSTPTATAYAAKFDNGAIAMEELGTNPTWNTNYGMLYVKTDGKLWFTDSATGASYDLTAGAGAATGDNGTAAGQMNFWDGSKWTYTETSEMVWDDTNKNVGIGVASPTSTNRLEVSNTGTTTLSAAVYATATSGGAAIRNYGGYFSADGTIARAVEGRATTTGAYTNYGGYFVASGTTGYGVYALANSATGWSGYFDGRAGVGEDLYVGQAGGTDDDYVYFDAGGEYIKYNNAQGFFDFSASSIAVGMASSSDDDYIRFDDGTNEYLMWNNTASRFDLSDDLNLQTAQASSTGTAAAPVFTWSGDTNTGIYSSGADTFNITTGGTLAMTVSSTGSVTLAGNLQVGGVADAVDEYVYFDGTAESLSWDNVNTRFEFTDDIYIASGLTVTGSIGAVGTGGPVYGNATGSFGLYSNRIGSDGNLLRFDRDGANVGLITVASGTITYGTFTGSHYVLLENDNIERGQLIHLTGNNSYKGENNTGEMIYGAKISEMANDPAIIGSYFSVVEDGDGLSWAQAVGNGDMWVVDNGSNLEIGDYLISSDVPGHAMKVTDEYPVAYVVARVAENVDWSKVEEKTEDGIKHKKISVFFESFILNQDLGLAFDKNQNLDDLSWFYAMEAKTPVEKAIQNQKQQLDALETKVEMIEKDGCSNNEAILMETIEKLEARIEALEGQSVEPVKTSFWSKLW